ncbi:nucleotide sugar dehydrogenase [Lysinibacillus sp. SGAir0095]|uniref:nucleotide sugar dehydrogenase n=1 Tax=Lysinibacillus sp. SGAir0095 TaxID=2070463 RepID=UPI0010CCEC26|nr:nucleotide sugar dehydrogenase [Lysinibacillus sp. SGAir0095]QCR34289.1 nucleotide sugar dehydrogenase [Lysinibacillus sp. SGAir0095]
METKKQSIAVLGLGFVGLPLCQRFLEIGNTVHGIDIDRRKVESILNGEIYNPDINKNFISECIKKGQFVLHDASKGVANADVIIICVPTPLTSENKPDLSYVIQAISNILPYLKENQLVCLESTTYPGTTEELILPRIEAQGFQIGKNIYLAYSPERINPGSTIPLQVIPKVVGGTTEECLKRAVEVYESIFDTVHKVSSTKAAEMTKILENTQRFINISFINDCAILCEKMNIDIFEVIEAAATKPYGFVPFTPSTGIGGHCIPIDPLYLSWKAKEFGHESVFINIADQINKKMPEYITEKILDFLLSKPRKLSSSVLLIGLAYKKDINDVRESASLKIMEYLLQKGIDVAYYDPYVPQVMINSQMYHSIRVDEISNYDVNVLLTEHTNLPYEKIYASPKNLLDLKKFFVSSPRYSKEEMEK